LPGKNAYSYLKYRQKQLKATIPTTEVNTCPTCGFGIADEEGLLILLEILERRPHYCGVCKGRPWTYTADLRR
jgi:hypothetical protein